MGRMKLHSWSNRLDVTTRGGQDIKKFGMNQHPIYSHSPGSADSKNIKTKSEVHLEVPALAPTFQFKYTKENSQNTKEILNDFDFLFLA